MPSERATCEARWKPGVWAKGRYYVKRGTCEAAGTAQGGVYIFARREHAQAYADQLNRKHQPREVADE
jgi:hypothetical protein